MKKYQVIILALIGSLLLAAIAFYWLCFAPRRFAEYRSPDDKYRLVVYSVPRLIAGPGQGSDDMAIVELRGRKGELLARLSDRDKEAVMVRDVVESGVDWKKNEVWFAKARMFKLH